MMPSDYFKVAVTGSGRKILVSFADLADNQIETITTTFSAQDVFDAYTVFESLLVRELQREECLFEYVVVLAKISNGLRIWMVMGDLLGLMYKRNSLNTSLDVVKYGRNLLDPVFR